MGKNASTLKKIFTKKKLFTEAQILTVMNQIAVDKLVENAEQKKRGLALHFLEKIALPYRGAIHVTIIESITIATLAFADGSVLTLQHKGEGVWR